MLTLYHNPDCGTSRNVLHNLLRLGLKPVVILYLEQPPPPAQLLRLAQASGLKLQELLRIKGSPYHALGLDAPHWSDAQRLEHMQRHPILINRPLLESPTGVRLCRPSDLMLDLLPGAAGLRLEKEDGTPLLRDSLVEPDDPGLKQAWRAAGLPDLPTGTLAYRYATTDGDRVAHAAVSTAGGHAWLHGIAPEPAWRDTGATAGVLALASRRAFDRGARQLWTDAPQAGPAMTSGGWRSAGLPPASLRPSTGADILAREISL